jgi:hypothetical protein
MNENEEAVRCRKGERIIIAKRLKPSEGYEHAGAKYLDRNSSAKVPF